MKKTRSLLLWPMFFRSRRTLINKKVNARYTDILMVDAGKINYMDVSNRLYQ